MTRNVRRTRRQRANALAIRTNATGALAWFLAAADTDAEAANQPQDGGDR